MVASGNQRPQNLNKKFTLQGNMMKKKLNNILGDDAKQGNHFEFDSDDKMVDASPGKCRSKSKKIQSMGDPNKLNLEADKHDDSPEAMNQQVATGILLNIMKENTR